jgi:signal peptidase I
MSTTPSFSVEEVVIDHAPAAAQRSSRVQKQLSQGLLLVAGAFFSYFLVSHFFMQSVRVTGVSMQPTLQNSQHCFLNRWVYYFRAPARGDIVVIRDPQDNGLAVKRIIGVAGDTLEVTNGPVLLNGRPLREPYLAEGTMTFPGPSFSKQILRCGKSEYIVMGDNRLNSADSRNYGPVSRNRILGLIIR